MLQAIVISNGIEGLKNMFQSNEKITYTMYSVTKHFDPELSGFDILIVPNGSDNIAMYRIRKKVKQFLDKGGSLFCFDGFFTDWIPGNKWIMSNELKTIDVRYHLVHDAYNLFDNIDLNKFIFSHGMSGWWACGYIETQNEKNVLLADTLNRPVVVLDETSTNGFMFLTASGPMADMPSDGDINNSWNEVGKLYQNLIKLLTLKKQTAVQLN